MASTLLDTVTDDYSGEGLSPTQVIDELVRGTRVTWEIETEVGPAGGWPIVRYTAPTQEELDVFVKAYFD